MHIFTPHLLAGVAVVVGVRMVIGFIQGLLGIPDQPVRRGRGGNRKCQGDSMSEVRVKPLLLEGPRRD
jgi:hypothetical protein